MTKPSNSPIVVIEDNPDDQHLIARALRKNGVANSVQLLSDGEQALQFFDGTGPFEGRDTSQLPQVVLLDLHLPKVGGIQILRHLRERDATRTLPVVVLTSSDEERDIVESYRLGANSFVRKPLDFHEFIHAVSQLGMYWLLINRTHS